VSPLIISLIGFSLIKGKRYYASIFSFLALMYLFIDYQKEWITSFMIFGTKQENFTNGILGIEYAPHFFLINSIAFGIAIYFLVSSYFVNSKNSNEDFNYIENDKNIISAIIGIVFGLSSFFIVKDSNFNNKGSNNNESSTTVVDSSYAAPEEVPTSVSQESFSDTAISSKIDTTNYEYNSVNENQNTDSYNNNPQHVDNNDNIIYSTSNIEVKPDFPGGIEKFYKFIGENINYPNEDLTGSVLVSFVVQKDGTLGEYKIIKDIGYGAGDEVIRVLKKSPRWKPGEQEGVKVRTMFTLPINF
jgi:hypothetical protein